MTRRILLRASRDPFTVVRPEAVLGQRLIGNNVGNLLFSDAVHRMLSVPGAEITTAYRLENAKDDAALADRVNDQYDTFALPLANAFRSTFIGALGRLADTIERLTIPVTVIGVGAQADLTGTEHDLSDDDVAVVRRFMAAVLDHSPKVGVRGEHTRRFLAGLGFGDEHVEVIGCPSLFGRGPELRVSRGAGALEADSPVAVNITPHVQGIARIVDVNAERYPKMIFVGQEYPELELLLWGEQREGEFHPDLPMHTAHRLYQENRMRFFLDPTTWVGFMRTQRFAFGTRIHGNVAAVLAGTPAMILAHDSRVLELAEYHRLPYTTIAEVGTEVDAADLYDRADFAPFNAAQPELFAHFCSFLEASGLEHVAQPGLANPDYDDRLAATPFPPGVQTLTREGVEGRVEMASRLRWLRQGVPGDRARRQLTYSPPKAPMPSPPPPSRFSAVELDRVRDKARDDRRRVARLERRLQEQSAELQQHRDELKQAQRTIVDLSRELAAQRRTLARVRGLVQAVPAPVRRLGRQLLSRRASTR